MDKQQDLDWELMSTDHVVQDEWIDFRRNTFRMPDGSVVGPFYDYSRRSYAVIVASDTEGRFLCVRQYRQGIRAVTTEFPAGGIEPEGVGRDASRLHFVTGEDHGAPENVALETARRELREETGYVSDHWTHLLTVPSCATITDNYAHIYLAESCRPAGDLDLDDTEFLRPLLLTGEEVDDLIRQGGFQQAVHILAWILAKERRAGKHH